MWSDPAASAGYHCLPAYQFASPASPCLVLLRVSPAYHAPIRHTTTQTLNPPPQTLHSLPYNYELPNYYYYKLFPDIPNQRFLSISPSPIYSSGELVTGPVILLCMRISMLFQIPHKRNRTMKASWRSRERPAGKEQPACGCS